MLKLRKANERGNVKIDWLDAYHSFSFGHYFDPAHMGFKSLRVINEDYIDAGMGFDTHPHRNMEIITFMIEGSLAHKDSMGNVETIKPGEIQVMSAGTGITHSEFNPDRENKTHSIQIWVTPDKLGITPRYEQLNYKEKSKNNSFTKLLSPKADEGSLKVHQKMNLWYGRFDEGQSFTIPANRSGWFQIISGEFSVKDLAAQTSDGVIVEDENELKANVKADLEVLWFEFLES